jgi:hypothetical protein
MLRALFYAFIRCHAFLLRRWPNHAQILAVKINIAVNNIKATGAQSDQTALAWLAARVVVGYFLGEPFCEKYIKPSMDPDPYMLNISSDSSADLRFRSMERIASLADYLYRLRKERGFDILIERLTSGRDMRSVYLESAIASHYKQLGFSVEILPLSGKRGHDFDFKAKRGPQHINVEVTGSTKSEYSANNIANILYGKRSQLPDSGPGFIYCIISQEWIEKDKSVLRKIEHETLKFYQKTRTGRINAVVYTLSIMKRIGEGAAFRTVYIPILNRDARHSIDLSFMFSDQIQINGMFQKVSVAPMASNPERFSYWRLVSDTPFGLLKKIFSNF